MKIIYTLILVSLFNFTFGQSKFKDQIKTKKKYTKEVVDEVYGITMYEPFNMILSGDSVRMEGGYAAQNWQEDHYESGQLLHKGYYIDGQLKVYKNYYPDGTLERTFVNIDGYRSKVSIYYPDGKIKSEVQYDETNPKVWTDYYANGNMEYYEEYHKSMLYHIAKRSYFESGKPSSLLEMTNKKKLEYSQNDFYKTGTKKVVGTLKYDKDQYDYYKTGKWYFFNEAGAPTKDEEYDDGKVVKTKTY
ncbi:MAG: hypothetical protein ACI8Q1_000331 [Parvicella sp.]|jgi:hypothetical protein